MHLSQKELLVTLCVKHHIERAGWDWGDLGDLEATGKVAGALPRDLDCAPAEVHPESPPLTDLVLDNVILLSKNELETITRLDRLPRSLRREAA